MKPKIWPRKGQESFLGEISSLEISRFQAQDVAKTGLQESFLGEISSLEISRWPQDGASS